jgi:hypothetical protein
MPKKKTPVRSPWTKDDIRQLKAHSKTRTPVVEVAKAMKRTEAAVRQRRRQSALVSVIAVEDCHYDGRSKKRRVVKRVYLSRRPSICACGHQGRWGADLTLTTRQEQIENILHPTREVNSTRVAAVRPRFSARPGPANRRPAPARNTVVTLRCRRGGRSASRRGAAARRIA